jgi:preprotein translocase subunit SecA
VVFQRLLRAGEGRMLRRLHKIASHINGLEDGIVALSDDELRAKTEEFKRRYAAGESLDELLPEAFAVAREAAHRTLGQRPFDVQLMGGAALHLGQVAEMKTGEGKTLTCVLPSYLNALSGDGVHVVTVNDYLAKRDAEWMGRIHHFLGLEVGVILSQMSPDERRKAYQADITYGTNNEFGFDYLRDNMAWTLEECVQRGHNFAIVDEVDSILIDEARTPLIISGPTDESSSRWYMEFSRIANMLHKGEPAKESVATGKVPETGDYSVDEKKRTVAIHEQGVTKVEDQIGIENLYEAANTPFVGYLNNALKAKELFKRDRDYIVRNGEVLIVDEFTGRVLHGRRYNEGMHQAIEAKEGVEIKAENQTLATITLQNYFRLYDRLAGMTGTAQTEAAELHQTYKLGVVSIPTNKPMIRIDQPDLVYKTEEGKFAAVVQDIIERHDKGQPVLVGTVSVEKSEYLSKLLLREGVPHQVLNAKHHEREAAIVAQAGTPGAVTVSTNMAGRGTDIMLGGNPEFMADQALRERGLDPVDTPEEYEAGWASALKKARASVAEEYQLVRESGGLYVLGTERHESRRIDNQLRGRSGRQGDPGESRFYLSLGDDLMRRFNSSMVEAVMTRLNMPEDVPIEAKMVSRAIKSAQTQVEQQNFEIRKNVLKYDEVMNRQRKVIYAERRRVLEGEDIVDQVQHMLSDVITAYVQGATEGGYAEDWDLDQLWNALRTLYPVGIRWQDLAESEDDDLSPELLRDAVLEDARAAYARREAEVDAQVEPGAMRQLERYVVLRVLDRKWREHLYEMDYLKEGIGLRAMAQRDPLIEYQREGYDMFAAMLDSLKEAAVSDLFRLQVQPAEPAPTPAVAAPGSTGVLADATSRTGALGADGSGTGAGRGAASAAGRGRGAASRRGGGAAAGSGRGATAGPARGGLADGTPDGNGAPADDQGQAVPPALRARGLDTPRPQALTYSGPAEGGGTEVHGAAAKRSGGRHSADPSADSKEPSRNAPCPCGSGKKYKKCHGAPTGARP